MVHIRTQQGERRVLSLLFSDLAGSAELSAVLDPEDLRDVYLETREIVFAAVEKYGGTVKDYVGDGILAYFGYPAALERGAQAAVNAGLEMVQEIMRRSWPVVEDAGFTLHMRVGIHTGEVVVGDLGTTGGPLEKGAVVGAAPIIASRVQTAAAPDTVAISETTYQLVAGQFSCKELPPSALKGLPKPIGLYEVLASGDVKRQVERISTRRIRPLVGRSREFEQLSAEWESAASGGHPGVCVQGEAGIGKSRLMAELKSSLLADGVARVWEFQCSPYQVNTALFPVVDTLQQQVCEFAEGDSNPQRLEKLQQALQTAGLQEPVNFWLLADLLGLPFAEEAELAAIYGREARKREQEELLASLFASLAATQRALFEFNDAHWMDASTVEWVPSLRRRLTDGALIALTSRPDAPSVASLVPEMKVIPLRGLEKQDVELLARSVAEGRILPREVVDHIARSCSGVPLFVEEMTAALISSSALEEKDGHYTLKDWSPARQLPFSLRDLLQSRLDQLGTGDREVAQVCSVIGMDVTPRFAAAVIGEPAVENTLASLGRLADAGFLEHDLGGGTYSIRHALIRNAAYESLLKATRASYHKRVAELLQSEDFVDQKGSPELRAEHFTLAGLFGAAVPLWLQAAHHALQRSAVAEGVALARRGLSVLSEARYPAELSQVRVQLVTTLGTALVASKGFAAPDAARAFEEAEALLDGVENPALVFPVAWGLSITHLMQGHLNPALSYATRMLEIGRQVPGGHLLIEALWTRGVALFWLGQLDEAEAHLKEAVAMYRPEHHANAAIFGQDPGVAARVYLTQLLAFRMQAGEAMECAHECLALAHRLRHPHSLAWAMASSTMVKLLLNDVDGMLASGQDTIEYCMKQEHPFWLSATKMMYGWALGQRGRAEEGLKLAREGFALYELLGTNLISPVFCTLLADCCSTVGDPEEAASWAARGRDMVERNDEQLSLPVVLMFDGQLMQRAGGAQALRAESCFREAHECARLQGNRLREIQAAALLAGSLLEQGRAPEALETLTPYRALLSTPDVPEFLRPLAALFAS